MLDDYNLQASHSDNRSSNLSFLLVLFTSMFALLAAVWPLPIWAIWIRPEFVVITVVYWIIVQPFRIGLVYAWFMGFGLDLLTGSVLCQNALGMTVVAYITFIFHQRLSMYSSAQQAAALFVLVLLFKLIQYWIYGLTGGALLNVALLLPAFSSAVIWPFIGATFSRFK